MNLKFVSATNSSWKPFSPWR